MQFDMAMNNIKEQVLIKRNTLKKELIVFRFHPSFQIYSVVTNGWSLMKCLVENALSSGVSFFLSR